MRDHKDFLTICYKAKRHARAFIKELLGYYEVKIEDFLGDPKLASQIFRDYINRRIGIPVVYGKLQVNYASWLVADSSGSMSIAISLGQLFAWEKQTQKNHHNQMLLCLIHEFAHTQITPRLMEGTTLRAMPEEEERAWVYAYAFITTVCGHYSYVARKGRDVDDVLKFVV